jgi:hypothetical protein
VSRARNVAQTIRAVASEPKPVEFNTPGKSPAPEAVVSTKSASVNKEQGEDLYKDMYLGRTFEDTCAQMYYRGKMFGFVHLYCGQEAVSTGIIRQLEERDYVCSTYRDHVHAISKGVHPNAVMSELFGKATGICRGQGGSMHMFSKDHGFVCTPSFDELAATRRLQLLKIAFVLLFAHASLTSSSSPNSTVCRAAWWLCVYWRGYSHRTWCRLPVSLPYGEPHCPIHLEYPPHGMDL